MADRVTCTLIISGETDIETWAKVTAVIDEYLAPDEEYDPGCFIIHEVAWGTLPYVVENAIREAGLSYMWFHDASYEWGQGCELYNAETGEGAAFNRDGYDLTLPVAQFDNTLFVESARKWQPWLYEDKELVIQ